jgi:hypothetical protein
MLVGLSFRVHVSQGALSMDHAPYSVEARPQDRSPPLVVARQAVLLEATPGGGRKPDKGQIQLQEL